MTRHSNTHRMILVPIAGKQPVVFCMECSKTIGVLSVYDMDTTQRRRSIEHIQEFLN